MEKSFKMAVYAIGLFFAALLINLVTVKKFETLKTNTGMFAADIASIKDRERQLGCLAINIYKEAGHESFEGKVAIAQVTMNRAANPQFPNDICQVVYQKNVVMEKVICQFSWYCDSAHRNKPVNQAVYNESYEVAKKVLLEGFKLELLKDALYYHAVYVNPQWPLERIGKIGQHIFYKPKNAKNQLAKI